MGQTQELRAGPRSALSPLTVIQLSRNRMYLPPRFRALIGCLATILYLSAMPRAPQAHVFSLTPEPGPFTEPAIAVNPANPRQVVAVFQDNAHAAYSQDA